ncbi:MAG: hypothetical protein K2G37_05645 [Clostridia bacterium]|nr:hypothetical protein [Clostridia bacterium]MDE7329409.1 hypothetical protein [Clostridia bacterium]
MQKLFEVKNDLFNISARIKSIDENYEIYFNGDTRRYELHHRAKKPTYQLTFPYTRLDKRALDYTLESAIKNRELILRKIKEHNAKAEKEMARKLFEKAMVEAQI